MSRINPYYTAQRSTPMSQFVEQQLPAELMLSNLKDKQARQDTEQAKMDLLAAFDAPATLERDKKIVAEYRKKAADLTEKHIGTDLTTGEAKRELFNLANEINSSSRLKDVAANNVTMAEFNKKLKELEGDSSLYDISKARSLAEIAKYNEIDPADETGALGSIGAQKNLDRESKRASIFSGLQDESFSKYGTNLAMLGNVGKIREWGVSNDRVKQLVAATVYNYMDSNEGKQDLDEFNYYKQNGMLTDQNMEAEDYIKGKLWASGASKIRSSSDVTIDKDLSGYGANGSNSNKLVMPLPSTAVATTPKDPREQKLEYKNAKNSVLETGKTLQAFIDSQGNKTPDQYTGDEIAQFQELKRNDEAAKRKVIVMESNNKRAEEAANWDPVEDTKQPYFARSPNLTESLRKGLTYEEYLASVSEEERKAIKARGAGAIPYTVYGGSVATAGANPGANTISAGESSYNALAQKYNTRIASVADKVTYPMNVIAGEPTSPIGKLNTMLTNDLHGIDFTTLDGQSSASNDIITKINKPGSKMSVTDNVVAGSPVVNISYLDENKEEVSIAATLDAPHVKEQVARALMETGVKGGTKLQNKNYALGTYMLGYDIPPTLDQNPSAANAKGSLGLQIESLGIANLKQGTTVGVTTYAGDFNIRRLTTGGTQFSVTKDGKNIVSLVEGGGATSATSIQDVISIIYQYLSLQQE